MMDELLVGDWSIDFDDDGFLVCTVCDGTEDSGHEENCPILLGI
jgi:hypothetical protein